jgi:hypothetical protein
MNPLLVGTPTMIADQLQDLFESACCDGFILCPSLSPPPIAAISVSFAERPPCLPFLRWLKRFLSTRSQLYWPARSARITFACMRHSSRALCPGHG